MSIGFTLPLRRAVGGYFEMSNDLMTQIKSNFINLVSTMKGERLGNLTFGCDIHRVIFDFNDDLLTLPEIRILSLILSLNGLRFSYILGSKHHNISLYLKSLG